MSGTSRRRSEASVEGLEPAFELIVIMHLRLGQSLEEIAGKYDLDLADAHAAMAYYYDHRMEIDGSIEADEAFAEAFGRNNPLLLQAKLRALQRIT